MHNENFFLHYFVMHCLIWTKIIFMFKVLHNNHLETFNVVLNSLKKSSICLFNSNQPTLQTIETGERRLCLYIRFMDRIKCIIVFFSDLFRMRK